MPVAQLEEQDPSKVEVGWVRVPPGIFHPETLVPAAMVKMVDDCGLKGRLAQLVRASR